MTNVQKFNILHIYNNIFTNKLKSINKYIVTGFIEYQKEFLDIHSNLTNY